MTIPEQPPEKQPLLCIAGVDLDESQTGIVATYIRQHADFAKSQGILLLSTIILSAGWLLVTLALWDVASPLDDLLKKLESALTYLAALALLMNVGIIIRLQSRRHSLNRSMLENANLPYPVRMELHYHGKNIDSALLLNLIKEPFKSRGR